MKTSPSSRIQLNQSIFEGKPKIKVFDTSLVFVLYQALLKVVFDNR